MDENEIKNTEPETGITLPLIWHNEDKDELLQSTFVHSTETVRKDSKMDFLLTAVGVFAVICFAIMLYQCVRHNQFSSLNIICFICYAVIAVLFIPKPMQCLLSSTGWKMNLSKFAAFSGNASEVTLHNEKAGFLAGKKAVNVSYKYMESIFETANYFVLMVESKRILTFCKNDLEAGQIEQIRALLSPYMAEDTDAGNSVSDEVQSDTNDAEILIKNTDVVENTYEENTDADNSPDCVDGENIGKEQDDITAE